MKFACYSLAALAATDAAVWQPNRPRGWNWHSTHELSRGTADMPEAYDPNFSPTNPKIRDTILDTSGACSMNPFIFLALIDSNYGEATKFNMFGSRDNAGRLTNPTGQANDIMWTSLTNCVDNAGVQKLMAIDAMAKKRPDVVESILDTNVDASDDSTHQKIKDTLFDNSGEFYTNFWKYNEFIKFFDNTGYSKWARVNALLKIVGESDSPAERYRDRTFLMQNLKIQPFSSSSRQSTYLPAFNRPTANRYNFFAGSWNRPWFQNGFAPLGSEEGTESRRAIPVQGANMMPEVEQAEFVQAAVDVAVEQALQEALE
jgi:hypothetical protein